MQKIPFSKKELEKTGEYFQIPGPGTLPKYAFPITPRENFLRAVKERDPLWIPDYYDIVTLCPACYPDSIARGFVMGPEGIDYMDEDKKGGKDMFGIEWVYVPVAGGSMVEPGNPILEDMNDWRDVITMPDVESWNWAATKAKFDEHLKNEDGVRVLWIFTGLFERLIALLDFENAALALVDEDQEDALHSFFDELCGVYQKIIKHYKEDLGADIIYFHDDWGAQKSPFFSLDACMEFIVPYLKRIVDYVHSLGILFEMHSCGMNDLLVPAYLEAGIDIWAPQQQNDFEKIIEMADGKIVIGIWDAAPVEGTDEEKYAAGKAVADTYAPDYAKHPVYTCNLWDVQEKFKEGLYVESRKIFCGSEDE